MRSLTLATARRSRAVVALLIVLFTMIAGVILGTASARADVPDPPAAAPFAAPLCEGTTPSNPAVATGAVPDLTLVFGQRLVDYNSGKLVHLYGTQGTNGATPSCTVRYVDGMGPVSEWTFCTDHKLEPCTTTAADGSLAGGIPGLSPLEGNDRLTSDQERLIAYIIRHDLPAAYGGATIATNETSNSRTARQLLVWCVSDPDENIVAGFCDSYMNATEQQRILALVSTESELTFSLAADSTDLEVGDIAHVNVTTNIYSQPIALETNGGSVSVCAGDAVLSGGMLTVAGADAATSTTITLCVTSTEPGTVTVAGSAAPTSREHVSWVQSDSRCQVFATFEAARANPIASSAAVQFRAVAAETGGFSVSKAVVGEAAESVPMGTAFTVSYTVDGGESQSLTVLADGTPVAVTDLPEGAVVALSEVALPAITGVTWAAPVFSIDGEESTTVTIGADEIATVVLTNTANPTPVVPEDPENPAVPGDPGKPAAPDAAGGGLAITGGTAAWGAAGFGAILLLAGAATISVRRRRSPAEID